MTLGPPRCWERSCKHFIGVDQPDGTELTERVVCTAFPNGIPDEIAKQKPMASEVELKVQRELRQLSSKWGMVHAPRKDGGELYSVNAMYSPSPSENYLLSVYCSGKVYSMTVYKVADNAPLTWSDWTTPKHSIGEYDGEHIRTNYTNQASPPELYSNAKLEELYPAAMQLRSVVAKASGLQEHKDRMMD